MRPQDAKLKMLRVVCCTICMYKNKHVLETKRILRGVLWYATVQDPVYHSEMYLVVPLSIPKKTQAWMLRPPKNPDQRCLTQEMLVSAKVL